MTAMNIIEQSLTDAFSAKSRAARQKTRCWVVSGTNVRGESFTMRPTDRYSADDFAAEIKSLGGVATVKRVQR